MRYVMRIAEFSESSNFRTHIALPGYSWQHVCLSVCSPHSSLVPYLERPLVFARPARVRAFGSRGRGVGGLGRPSGCARCSWAVVVVLAVSPEVHGPIVVCSPRGDSRRAWRGRRAARRLVRSSASASGLRPASSLIRAASDEVVRSLGHSRGAYLWVRVRGVPRVVSRSGGRLPLRTSNQTRRPAGFKHINKRRKRN